jgi:hypothetical protein
MSASIYVAGVTRKSGLILGNQDLKIVNVFIMWSQLTDGKNRVALVCA